MSMSSEEDILFGGGGTTTARSKRFGGSAPSAQSLATSIAGLDLEATVGTAKLTPPPVRRSGRADEIRVTFEEPAPVASLPEAIPRMGERTRVRLGPTVLDADRIAELERPSLLSRIARVLFGWLR